MYAVTKLLEPTTLNETWDFFKDNIQAKIIAGGTDLLIKMRHNKLQDMVLISIGKIKELAEIQLKENGYIEIGSLVTFTCLAENQIIREKLPMLKIAALSMGGPQIRNMATIGGNICNGATSADSAPSLFALNAELELVSSQGTRIVKIQDFYLGPSKVDLQQGEILTKIIIPPISQNWGGHYIKFSIRKAMDISMLGCAAICSINDNKEISDLRIALGTAAPTPVRCTEAEKIAINKKLSPGLLAEISSNALLAASPRSSWRASKEYRQELIKELVAAALKEAYLQAGGGILK